MVCIEIFIGYLKIEYKNIKDFDCVSLMRCYVIGFI